MESERRLHPASIFFGLFSQIKELAFPLVIVVVAGSSSQGGNWEFWGLLFLIPYSIFVVGRYLTFSYAFDETELVVRSGVFTRNERHIPYARIQNLDAAQNVFHRAFGVVVARVDTGGGEGADATLSVITRTAYEEMRARVFEKRDALAAPTELSEPRGEVLLTLPTRELVVQGLIENRGMIVIAGAMGLLFQTGAAEDYIGRYVGESDVARFFEGFLQETSTGMIPWNRIAFGVMVFGALLVLIRVFSVALAVIRLHGFKLERIGEDLRAEFGLFTRVTSTVPLRRVQTITVSAGLLHRLSGRASVRVDTAGGDGPQVQKRSRESLAPIIHGEAWPALVHDVVPELDLDQVAWRSPAPGALGREFRQHLVVSAIFALLFVYLLHWWTLGLFALLVLLSWFSARGQVRNLGWAMRDGVVLHKSGWLRRHVTIARLTRIQAVALHESPFDRRRRMARVHVDTAGAGGAPHRIHIPYLARDEATGLHDLLAAAAGRTAFRW
jgi:putative membrane protein